MLLGSSNIGFALDEENIGDQNQNVFTGRLEPEESHFTFFLLVKGATIKLALAEFLKINISQFR